MLFNNCCSLSLVLAEVHAAPPLQGRVDTLLFSLIIFGVLVYVLFRYAWKPIIEGLDKREKAIANEIESAQKAHEQAQANLRQYEERLSAVTNEANAILAEAKKDAVAAKERILAEAQEEAKRTRDRALADIEAAKNAAVQELAERSVDSAVSLAGSIVGRSLEKGDHSRLIADSIKSFNSGA